MRTAQDPETGYNIIVKCIVEGPSEVREKSTTWRLCLSIVKFRPWKFTKRRYRYLLETFYNHDALKLFDLDRHDNFFHVLSDKRVTSRRRSRGGTFGIASPWASRCKGEGRVRVLEGG